MGKAILIIIAIFVFVGGIVVVSRKDTSSEVLPGPVVPTIAVLVPEPTIADITLTITQPEGGAVVKSASLIVKGTTKPNAEVFVNEKEARADGKGNFSVPLMLEEGDNDIVVTVTDEDGNISEQGLTVSYEPEQ